jgi:hypothetical protein
VFPKRDEVLRTSSSPAPKAGQTGSWPQRQESSIRPVQCDRPPGPGDLSADQSVLTAYTPTPHFVE